MATFKKTIQCVKCRHEVGEVWPISGGICGDCLVKNVSLKDTLENTCACLRPKIIELYKRNVR